MSRFRTPLLSLTALAGSIVMALGAAPVFADGGDDDAPPLPQFDIKVINGVQELSPPFEPGEHLAPNPTPTPVIGEPIAAIVCPDGTVVEYHPGEVDDPFELCPDDGVTPGLDITEFCYDEDEGLVACDEPGGGVSGAGDLEVCIPPTHGDNPCDDDGLDPGPDEPLGECADPESFPSYEDFANHCVFVECLDEEFPKHAVPLIACMDANPLCLDLHNFDSFDAYFEECHGEPGDDGDGDEVPDDGDDDGDGGDEAPDDGNDDSHDDDNEVVHETGDDDGGDGAGDNAGKKAPGAPEAGTGAFQSVPGGGVGMASLGLVAAGGALAGALLRRRA